jgi:hypothetical protein
MKGYRRTALTASLALASALGGCSEFNMTPPCAEAGPGVALALIPNSLVPPGGQLDKRRVWSLVTVSDLSEIASGYNHRTCQATLSLADGSLSVRTSFRLEQAEGAQSWQKVTFLDVGRPDFDQLITVLHTAYAGLAS